MKVPGLERRQIVATARLAGALRDFLVAHDVVVPPDKQLALGEGTVNLEDQVLIFHYEFFDFHPPVD